MKYCPTCNAEFEPEHAYCAKDGTRLIRRSRAASASQVGHGRTALKAQRADDRGDPWDPTADPSTDPTLNLDADPGLDPGAEPDEQDLVGHLVAGRYLIERRLGDGGMGVVYAGVDQRLEKPVAVKVLREDLARRTDVVARFTQEAKSAARIKHENVLDVTDYGQTEDGSFYITMELLVGADLADALQKHRTIEPDRGMDIAIQICRALSSAHQKGVIHRDLKPENVFLTRSDDGREIVKIVDFGIAQMKDITGASPDSARKLTRTGMIFGTPEYMSPEQAAGKSIDHRVDVYATGVILYEMFAGRVPFVGETFMGVLTQHMFEQPPRIHDLNPAATLSPDLESVIFKALAKAPADRYASMQDLADDLGRVRMGSRPTAPPPGPMAVHSYAADRLSPAAAAPVSNVPAFRPDVVGVSRTVESELTRVPSRRPLVYVGGGILAVAIVIVGVVALNGRSVSPPSVTPPTVTPAPLGRDHVVPLRPGAGTAPVPVPAVPSTGSPPLGPSVAAPALPPPAPMPALVHLRVSTGAVMASVRAEGADAGVVFQCDHTPCDQQVSAGVALHLTATSPHRRGVVDVTPATDGQAVEITMVPARPAAGRDPHGASTAVNNGRPHGGGTNPPGGTGGRRCGYLDPATQLLVPCFP